MSTVIKANQQFADIQATAFNFDDVTTKANRYLENVRTEAARILAEANKEAQSKRDTALDETRKAGFEAGREEGLESVREMVSAELGQQLTTLMPALQKAVGDIQHAKQAWLTHFEKSAVQVACAIAERILRRELPQHPEVPLTLVREALELAAGSATLKIRLHPDDHKALLPQIETLVQELVPAADTEFLADEKITAGGCRVETAFGLIDQQFATQLARIEEELT